MFFGTVGNTTASTANKARPTSVSLYCILLVMRAEFPKVL